MNCVHVRKFLSAESVYSNLSLLPLSRNEDCYVNNESLLIILELKQSTKLNQSLLLVPPPQVVREFL